MSLCVFFFFNDTATTEIYTLSLHDALPILIGFLETSFEPGRGFLGPLDFQDQLDRWFAERANRRLHRTLRRRPVRSEEHTSELQSRQYLVCRLLLEKKKKQNNKS